MSINVHATKLEIWLNVSFRPKSSKSAVTLHFESHDATLMNV